MQAPIAEQRALLQLQAHDSAIDRLNHRRGSLPEDARLAELGDALGAVDQLTAEREGTGATIRVILDGQTPDGPCLVDGATAEHVVLVARAY